MGLAGCRAEKKEKRKRGKKKKRKKYIVEIRSYGIFVFYKYVTENDCAFDLFLRCARLFPKQLIRDICGCDLTENADFEEGACVLMVAINELKTDV